MTCARYRALISRYLDDELTPRQRAELLDHLEHCASCTADLARFRQGELLVRKLPEAQPPPEIKRAVLREVRKPRRRQRRRLIGFLSAGGRLHPRLGASALGILLLLPVAAGLLLSAPTRQAIGARFGFSAPASPTISYLEVPASPTAPPPGPLSPPHLVATNPYDGAQGVDPRSGLLLRFDQAMDRRSVERVWRVSPPVPGDFQWEADNQLRFRPSGAGLLRGVHYTVALTDGARSLAGGTLPATTLWGFDTLTSPSLLAVYPAPDATAIPPAATLVLTFSQPMDMASLGPRLRLEGGAPAPAAADAVLPAPAGGGARWVLGGRASGSADGRVLRFTPEAPLPAGEVRVVLDAGGRDTLGGTLPPTGWTFSVNAAEDSVALEGPRLRTLALGGPGPVVTFNASADPGDREADSVHFALYPLARAQLESQLPWLLDPRHADAGGPWPLPNVAGQAPFRVWSSPIRRAGGGKGSPRPLVTGPLATVLPAHEPGLYLLTADIARGSGDARLVALSDEGVLLWARAGRWEAWVSTTTGGLPVAGAQVRLYGAAGTLLATGTTDAEGLFSAAVPAGTAPVLVLSEHNGNVAVAQMPAAGGQPAPPPGATSLDATVIRDRARYHAGDNILFTAVVRPPSVGLAGAPVAVRLRDPQGREIGALSLLPDAHGAINGALALAPGLDPGLYRLALELGDRRYEETLPVDPALAPPGPGSLGLRLQPLALAGYAGDTITPTVRASYAALQPAGGVTVTLRLVAAGEPGDQDEAVRPPVVLTATTGDDGVLRAPIRLPGGGAGPTRTYLLLAQGADSLGRTATALAQLDIHPGHAVVTQTLGQHAFLPGASVAFTVTVHDEAGQPLAGQPVVSGLFAPSPTPGGDASGGSLLNSVTGVTNADGVVTASLALPLQGAFNVRSTVSDRMGAPVSAAARIWVYQPDSAASWALAVGPATDVVITPDQDKYRPGDTARLLIQSAEPGGGLLVVRLQDQVLATQAITFGAGGGVFPVSIPANGGTASTVDIAFLRFAPGADGPHLLAQEVRLPLRPAGDAGLDLTLPEAPTGGAYLPGSALPVRLVPAGAAPGAGDVLLRLAPATPPPARDLPLPPAGSWPAATTPAPRPPVVDEATAYWSTALALEAAGQLSTTVRLPDRVGVWALDAWAFLPGGVRHTQQFLRTEAALDVQWALPTTLVAGDSTTTVATITNNQPGATNVDLHLQIPSGLAFDLVSVPVQTFHLAPGESRRATWTVRATAAGSGEVVLDAAWGVPGAPGILVHRAQTVVVAPYGIADTQTQAGSVDSGETINMTLPPDVDPAGAQLEIVCAPSLAGVLADAAAALTPPPAGGEPVDTVAARLRAGGALGALWRRQGLDPDVLPAGPGSAVPADLAYLYSAQRPDGGWGAWPGAPADLATSTRVLEALWQAAQDGGLAVDPATVARGLAWLQTAITDLRPPGPPGTDPPDPAAAARVAEALYVLSLHNRANPGDVDRLLAVEPALAPRERAFLTLILARSGQADTARLVVERLAARPADAAPDPIVLDALLSGDAARIHGPVVAEAEGLLAARTGALWSTPAGTAAAVVALAHYITAIPDAPAAGTYRILVNGQVLREVVAAAGKTEAARVVLTVPGTRLHTGDNPVRLEATGVRLYYSLRVQAILAGTEHPITARRADGVALGLLRVFTPGPATTVALTLTVTAPTGPLRLDDPLPGGLARLPGLTFERLDDLPDAPGRRALPGAIWAAADSGGALHLWLGPLPPGTYMLTYQAVTVATGRYSALPALLVSPSDAAVWVRSGGDSLLLER